MVRGRMRHEPGWSPRRRRLTAVTAAAILAAGAGLTVSQAAPAHAAGGVTVTVTAGPQPVASGQAMAYTVNVANAGGADASGLTLTDAIGTLVAVAPQTSPFFKVSSGSCAYDSSTTVVTCTTGTVAAGGVWSVSVIGGQSAAAGATVADTATVTGTESGATFTASGSTSTTLAPSLPAGFKQTQLAHGLVKPILVRFLPGSGEMWVGTQGGTIYDYRGGTLNTTTPVVTLPNVDSKGEDGLLGLAFDPDYATNGYVYISYTVNITNSGGTVVPYARLSRFTAAGGTISPATEKVYYQGNQAQALHHAGNDLQLGPDGKLWWAVADNDPAITNAETLGNIYGKILRFNLDGSVPADNPFVNVPSAVPYNYAWGQRNPWRFTFLPTGQAMVENTGSSYWEDLDTIQSGGNYGWDYFEGNCGSCGYLNPAYAYGHYPVDSAASALAAYSGSTFPAAYDHVVFFGDYNRRDIEAVAFDPTYTTELSDTVFDTNAGTIADLQEGPDGNLYFVSIFEGTVNEISAPGPFNSSSSPSVTAAGPAVPGETVTSTPVAGNAPAASITAPSAYNAGQAISFSGTATDPVDGTLPAYDYSWTVDFIKNGYVQPSYYAEIPGPFYGPVSGQTGASITIPSDVSQTPDSYYRITLTVTDSAGGQTVVTRDLTPNTTSWSVTDSVPGAGYFVDGAWHTGNYTAQDVVGVRHVLTGLGYAQTAGGIKYRFSGWADGSALTDSFTSAATPATYTADFDPVTGAMPAGWTSTDIGAPITAGTADYSASSQSFYLDGAGADEYGANDQSHFVYQAMPADGSIIARVRFQTNSSPWAKAGLMIRQSTAAGAPWVDALVTPDVPSATPDFNGIGCDANGCLAPAQPVLPVTGYGVRMQTSGSKSSTGPVLTGYTAPNKWLKLTRAGSTFTSYESTDGVNWTQIGVQTVAMTGTVLVGLFDTGHNIGQVAVAAFDSVQVTPVIPPPPPGPLPSPWLDSDVGSPALAGSAGYTGGVFSVTGAGADIWGTSDQFNYVYQPLSGDGNATIVARLTSMSNTSSNAKAGVMIKQSTTSGSDYVLIESGPSGTVKVQYDFNGETGSSSYALPNVWMKLVSLNGKFSAYLSSDGSTWTSVLSGKTLPITFPATIGLFECSHNASALGTATFDNVSFTPGP
jgi:uncharacterized repeat protein (TIGR01451 family)